MAETRTEHLSPSPEPSDRDVITEVLSGDVARFEVLMRRYNQRLFRTARAILRDDAEAEDAVQQAYLSAFSHLGQFEGRAQFSTWLTRITVHEALRRRRRRRLADLEAVTDDARLDDPPAVPSPEALAADAELRALLERAIDSLPESYRVVFVLREVQELSTTETAACLELSEEAVRVRLHRARKTLREWLYERADALTDHAFAFAGERCDRIVAWVLARLPETP